jgi:hypothetical protein
MARRRTALPPARASAALAFGIEMAWDAAEGLRLRTITDSRPRPSRHSAREPWLGLGSPVRPDSSADREKIRKGAGKRPFTEAIRPSRGADSYAPYPFGLMTS